MQNAEITTVTKDYQFALDELMKGNNNGKDNPNIEETALHLAKLAQNERHKRPFWSRIL